MIGKHFTEKLRIKWNFELTLIDLTVFKLIVFEVAVPFKHEVIANLAQISQKLQIKYNFELTVF